MAGGIEQTSGDIQTLQRLADEAKTLLRNNPLTERVSDDWGDAALTVDLELSLIVPILLCSTSK